MRRFILLFIAVGMTLVFFVLYLDSHGLDEKDLELYREALELEDKELWPDLELAEYPLAIRSGDQEYVIKDGEVKEREPALPVIAATAYPVDGEVNIFLPSKKEMDAIGEIMEGMMNGGEALVLKGFSMTKTEIPDERYVAFLYHEGLHAYQIQNYEENLFNRIPEGYDERSILEFIRTIDETQELKDLYIKEYEALYEAITNPESKLKKYLELRKTRIEELSNFFNQKEIEQILWLENYYEKVEGTARYLEGKVLVALDEKELYNHYIESLLTYADGKEKYYSSGMGMGLILDEVQVDWKQSVFKRSESMHQIMKETWDRRD